ncbi:MAG: SpoIIE family protein phosphatase, partial [Chloroflexia bacterium]|nr:SpoIIE family protein phosphatase [Chloroflexia bacterium]
MLSGDFYWFRRIETPANNLSISIVADCTGHGVPGALLSMLGISYLNDIIINQNEYRPDVILNKLRDYFINTLQQMDNQHIVNDGLDIAVSVIDNTTDILYYAGANRNIYLVRNNQLNIVKGDRMPIGKHINGLIPFTNSRIKLNDHDNIYMFTDGFADQFGGKNGTKFMRKRFRKLLLSVQNESFENQKNIMNRHFNQWRG